MTPYEKLLEAVYEIHDLTKAHSLLGWDRETNMPKAGSEARIQQMTTLGQIIHKKSTSDTLGELIETAAAERSDIDPDSNKARLIAYLQRTYEDARKLPADYVRRVSEVSGTARNVWMTARENNDFSAFQPHLEQVIALNQELATLYGYEEEAYDALLDKFELGMKTADVRCIFDATKAATIPLREAIEARGTGVDDSLLHQPFSVEKQERFARYIAAAAGYDFERGHLGTVVHPFATSFSRNDARITTRWYPNFLNAGLFGTLHESGHAMYEQGTHPDLARTPLARGTSMGIHESQSRMIENVIGRSREFWQSHYPKLQETFPEQLGDVALDAFYRAINKVQASFIRVEADELTYNFHIILRFELEQAMLSGDLTAKELPTAWNDKMNELLGIVPQTDSEGCLQDVHWTRPGFGYFPTYALGNLYAAQLYATATQQQPDIPEQLARGDTSGIVTWLRKHVHQHGRKYPPAELIQRATGKPLSHEPFVQYVTKKFSEIYEL